MIRKIVSALTVLLVAAGLAACSGSAEEQPTLWPTPPTRDIVHYTSAPEELIGPEEPSRGKVYIEKETMPVVATVSTLAWEQFGYVAADALVFASDRSMWLEPEAEVYGTIWIDTPNWMLVYNYDSGILIEPNVQVMNQHGNLTSVSYDAFRSEPLAHTVEEMAALGYVRVDTLVADSLNIGH